MENVFLIGEGNSNLNSFITVKGMYNAIHHLKQMAAAKWGKDLFEIRKTKSLSKELAVYKGTAAYRKNSTGEIGIHIIPKEHI